MWEWVLADPWIQLGSSRDAVGHQFCIFGQKSIFAGFWHVFGQFLAASRQVQTWCQKFETWCPTWSWLDPDWIPTGQKWCQKTKLVPDCVPTGFWLDPGWFSSKQHFPRSYLQNLSTNFWNFSTLPCNSLSLSFSPSLSLSCAPPTTRNSVYKIGVLARRMLFYHLTTAQNHAKYSVKSTSCSRLWTCRLHYNI